MKIRAFACILISLSPALAMAQGTETIVPHPALGPPNAGAEAMPPHLQLGKFGESVVREGLRADGFEVHDANIKGRGIDLLAVKRDARGMLEEVRAVEVKTRSRGTDFRLDATVRDGQQLSTKWMDARFAELADGHPDPNVRRLAAEIRVFNEAHPGRIRPQLHGLSIGENVHRVYRVAPKTGAIEGLVSEGPVTGLLKRLAGAKLHAVRQAALRHLHRFDQLQAGVEAHPPTPPVARLLASSPERLPAGEIVRLTRGAEVASGASVEAAAGATRLLPKAFRAAGKALPVAGAALDVGLRVGEAGEVERQFQRGEISDRDRIISHTKNGAEMAGGWGGAMVLGSQGAPWGTAAGPVGTVVGGVAGGAVGYLGGEKLGSAAVDLGSDAIYEGVGAARGAGRWAGEQLAGGSSAARSTWNSARSRLGW